MFKFLCLAVMVAVACAGNRPLDQAPPQRPVEPFYNVDVSKTKHQGTNIGVDANIPLVQGSNKLGPWSINGGAGVDLHQGGPQGDRMGDQRGFIGFEQKFGKK